MPIKKSAIKKVRQDKKRRLFNRDRKEAFKSKIKEVKKDVEAKKLDKAKEVAVLAISALDKAAKKNTIHKKTAARRKSRLMKLLNKTARKGVELRPRKKETPKEKSREKTRAKKSENKTKKASSEKS